MARSAIAILGDAGRWERMSALAAADARERFSRDDVVAQYESMYARALALPPDQRA